MPNTDYGKRLDGTDKGNGWYGPLPMLDGSNTIATELSISFDYGQGDVLVPLINPLLSLSERLSLLQGKEPTKEVLDKAGQWGFERIQQNKSPFIMENEKQIDANGLTNYKVKTNE